MRVDSARIAANPPTPIGVIAASEPPATITSASQRAMILNASPNECALLVQAVQYAQLGPFSPHLMLTCPAAKFTIAAGMKNGDIFRGPDASRFACSRSMMSNPPTPDAMWVPIRSALSAVTLSCDIVSASCDAAIAR